MAWGVYKNGNSICKINLDNGTKIRETKDDYWDLAFPESLDLNIGNRCDGGCPFCYINATPNGIDAELLNVPFIDTLHPYTEVAINGNSVDHPQLIPFLEKLKNHKIIANITVNQKHFERNLDLIKKLVDDKLIYGIGISLVHPTPKFINQVKMFDNAVIHVINGVITPEQFEILADNDLKILILGYKNLGRGNKYMSDNLEDVIERMNYTYNHLSELIPRFKVVSFDNLSIDQLDVKRVLSDDEWNKFYMGDEGTASMFVDLVTSKFGISSLCDESEMMPILDNIENMFDVIKRKTT